MSNGGGSDGLVQQIIGSSGLFTPSSYMGASMQAGQLGEASRQMAWDRRMGEKRFDIEKLLTMQNYREKEERRKWRQDFMNALGGLNG